MHVSFRAFFTEFSDTGRFAKKGLGAVCLDKSSVEFNSDVF